MTIVTNKNGIEFDIDDIATDLNGKADVDLTNVNNAGTSKSAGWAMPSTTYETITTGASDAVYTAPANGYFVAKGNTNTETNSNHPIFWVLMNDAGTTDIVWTSYATTPFANAIISVITPVKKGEKYKLTYGRMSSVNVGFIYAVGSESEA